MAVLDSIAIEIQATIGGVLILLLVTLLEIIDLQRAKKQHRLAIQEMSVNLLPGQKKRLVSLLSLSLQFIFGFAAFVFFTCFMMYLIIIGKVGLAVVAGVSAFVAVMMPFVAWGVARNANKETDELISRIQHRRQEDGSEKKTTGAPAKRFDKTQTEEKSGAAATEATLNEEVTVAAARTAPSSRQETTHDVRHEVFPKPDPAHVFPQDSMLRRHFIANLTASAKSYVPTRPTDSMLRRHYDAMMSSQSQTTAGSAHQSGVSAPETTKPSRKRSTKVRLPEDSMLRRHYLTTLRVKIESSLFLPSRPADSMLRRHFDAMKEQLIAGELQRYLEG